jgi:hypothetical protein
MRPFKTAIWGCALAALAAGGGSANAAWNNVFQVCCHSCRSSAYAAPPVGCCPQPCPQTQCTTRYVQRSYYQPVTTYRQSFYYEPVTTYRTSYYYEPVCSYRYSCYYDPCTCSYRQVAQPVTSYQLRSQCCPVTSYLQRCCLQPVTSYQLSCYYEPVTTCCTTTVGAPIFGQPPNGAAVAPAVPAVPAVPGTPGVPPVVGEGRQVPAPQPPTVGEGQQYYPPTTSEGTRFDRNPVPYMPKASDSSYYRQPQLQTPVPAQPTAPAQAPPRVRLERIAALPDSNLNGLVVRTDRAPQANARVLFVSADQAGARQAVTADAHGRFQVALASGSWLVYVQDSQGKQVFQRRVDVTDGQPHSMTLVSR